MIPTAGGANVITSGLTLTGNTLSFSTSALTAGTYNLAITHNSGCGTATATSTTVVTVAGNGTTLSPNLGVSQDNYFAIAPASMVNPQYQWETCTSAGVCTTVGGNSALLSLSGVTAPPAGNQVCVTVYPLGSTCKTRLCTAQGTHSNVASSVNAGYPLVFNYTVRPISGKDITAELTLTPDTAIAGTHYTTPVTSGMFNNGVTISGSTVTIPAGTSSFTLTIPTIL
jgi:hypothetical protein